MNSPAEPVSSELRREILIANIEEHRREARYYNTIHTEIFNRYEQSRCRALLKACTRDLGEDAACLDIGAGTGNITRKLLKLGFQDITCVDISKEMLAVLNVELGLPKERLICSDIDSYLDAHSDCYDLITMSSVVHHLPDYEDTLRRLFERLRPGGRLVITHEPQRPKNGTGVQGGFVRMLRTADKACYVLRYALLILLGRLKYLARDCSVSDYHTGERALDSARICSVFQGAEIECSEYATAKFGVFAYLLNYFSADNFQIVVSKK